MPPTILPLYDLPFSDAGAEAEKKSLNFLKALPENYFVLRELRMSTSREKQRAYSQEDRPDLVVIGPDIGVVVLEVKDWNLKRNIYEWLDQNTIRKTDELGQVTNIRNPYNQINGYIHTTRDLLKCQLGQQTVYVHGFVVYPRLTRAEFENAFTRGQSDIRSNVQEKFLVDIQRTVFSDMLDRYWDSPLELLRQLVKLQVKQPYAEVEIAKTVNALVPPKLCVGDISKQDRGYEHLLLMDEEQQKWAFSEEIAGKNYMLDVAGSGKTNIVLSRAMHLSDMHSGMPGYRVLVLTYSEALARDLERLLANKIKGGSSPDAHQYKQTIVIMHIAGLMESLLVQEIGAARMEAWRTHVKSQQTNKDEYLDIKLPEKCQDMLYEQSKRFQIFDYLLVDEVQDFSDFFLDVALCLLKKRENVFMVGDVGQKLFDRKHNLSELGMIEERVRVRGNYRMYRSPRLIARLSWAFLRQDRYIAHELREQAYEDNIKSKNTLLTQPVFKLFQTREELLKEICDDIANLVTFRARPEQVLCIGLTDTLDFLNKRFAEQNIPVCQAKEISLEERRVVLADFISSKGLERDYVYILDVDCLPDGSLSNASPFSSSEVLEQEARRSRIKIFVALTRAVREVYLYYTNGHSRFIYELLELAEGR